MQARNLASHLGQGPSYESDEERSPLHLDRARAEEEKKPTLQPPKLHFCRHHFIVISIVLCLSVAFFLFGLEEEVSSGGRTHEHSGFKKIIVNRTKTTSSKVKKTTSKRTTSSKAKKTTSFKAKRTTSPKANITTSSKVKETTFSPTPTPLPDPRELIDVLDASIASLEERMIVDYGEEHFRRVFRDEVVRSVVRSTPGSNEKLVRRIQIKFLKSVLNGAHPSSYPFTWVTGGHSASAGHGNMFNQSQTAILEDTVRQSFEDVGMKFVAKNRAMGGMSSGPEFSLCMESMYGLDIDLLSWDFGMTDGRDWDLIQLWGERAGMHRTRPHLFLMDSGRPEREANFVTFRKKGTGVFIFDQNRLGDLKKGFPDALLTAKDEVVPRAIKNYMCDGKVEAGTPCKNDKYDTYRFCKQVKKQTSWHPGWKDHMLVGRMLGMYLLLHLKDAISAFLLQEEEPSNNTVAPTVYTTKPSMSQSYLDYLLSLEMIDKSLFRTKTSPKTILSANLNRYESIHVMRHHSICHLSLLPSHIRYHHILYPPPTNGKEYEIGYPSNHIPNTTETDSLRLIFDPSDRQTCDGGNYTILKDYKDWFYIQNNESITLPSLLEIETYGLGDTVDGVASILLCTIKCDWGQCPPGDLSLTESTNLVGNATQVKIMVNDRIVTKLKQFKSKECFFLETTASGIFWDWDPEKRFSLKFDVKVPGKAIWLSAIVVLL